MTSTADLKHDAQADVGEVSIDDRAAGTWEEKPMPGFPNTCRRWLKKIELEPVPGSYAPGRWSNLGKSTRGAGKTLPASQTRCHSLLTPVCLHRNETINRTCQISIPQPLNKERGGRTTVSLQILTQPGRN